ncbi:alpha-mannosidase [Clostridium swellfunianum]|uniref:alpha-mannosidase n=1 Tax=Clostridium swellfunianum TaxID=1367462 RepID=UPI00202EE849|nr:alpha-mannosidase [Clostridium swellfunianum]MCM0650806.1 alpha-mannosidase [Clostridium swellfunianum]
MDMNNKIFFTIDKLSKEIQDLEAFRYLNRNIINQFYCSEHEETSKYPPNNQEWSIRSLGEHWKGRDKYLWVKIPYNYSVENKNNKLILFVDFGFTDGWHNSGFESLCFIDGAPFQGVDQNHKEIILPQNLNGCQTDIYLKLWSGLEGGGKPREIEHAFKQLFAAEMVKVDKFYYLAKTSIEAIKVLPEDDANKLELISILQGAFNLIDWTLQDYRDEFYNSLHNAYESLQTELDKLEKKSLVCISAVGHTHIDIAWLWRLKHTREKCARSFSTVLRYMDLYPDYTFVQSQPQLYEFIKVDYPQLYERIKEKIAEGRWEPNGGMWVEADCNVTSGESLVRQILFGKRFFKKEFNIESDILWLPDVFGYSWTLPQILIKSGIKTFITSKISWNKYNKMPYDTFYWRGMDGSEILTHFIDTPELQEFQQDWQSKHHSTYNGHITPFTIKSTWERYTNKEVYKGQIVPFGYGDGGGGVDRNMLETYEALQAIPGLPKVKQEKVSEFANKLHKAFDNTGKYVQVWDGELYLEYHRGTYTSQGYVKKKNRELENKYRFAEMLSVLNAIEKNNFSPYEQETLNDGWKIILRNQFHDIIPGSSITEVYEDAREEYKEADTLAEDIITSTISSLALEAEGYYTVFNPLSFDRTDLVIISLDREAAFYELDGTELESQKTEEGYIIKINNVPSLGYKTIKIGDKGTKKGNDIFSFKNNTIETPFYTVVFNKGNIDSIYDKENEREILAGTSNILEVYEDRPLNFDAWDIDIFYNNKVHYLDELISLELKEINSIRLVVNAKWKYKKSLIEQDIIFFRHTRRIDFKTKADWHEHQQLLKVGFTVEARATKATYDIQFGNIERTTHWNTSWDLAKFEVVGHKWADVSEGDYGVALLNNCKYGYDVKNNQMRLTLIKSAIHPDPNADQGEHLFTYSLLPHKGDFRHSEVEKEGLKLNDELKAFKGMLNTKIDSMLSLNTDNVIIDAVKKAEDDDAIIVRLHEYKGCRSMVKLSGKFNFNSWQEVNLMEEPLSELRESNIQFIIKPYEIKTIFIKLF